MAESNAKVRLSKAAREFNIGMKTVIEFLEKKGFKVDSNPNTKLEPEMYAFLVDEFQAEKKVKEIAHLKGLEYVGKQTISIENKVENYEDRETEEFDSTELFITNSTVEYTTGKKNHYPVKPVEKTKPQQTEKNPVSEKPVTKTTETSAEAVVKIKEKQTPIEEKITIESTIENLKGKKTEPEQIKVEKEAAPVEKETVEPIQQTIEPIQQTIEPIQQTIEPIQQTIEPIQQTSEPIQQTSEPIQQTIEPIQQTIEPIQQTIEPIQQTSEPIQPTEEKTKARPPESVEKPKEKIVKHKPEETTHEKKDARKVDADTKILEKTKSKTEEKKGLKVLGSIDLENINQRTRPRKKTKAEKYRDAETKSKLQNKIPEKQKAKQHKPYKKPDRKPENQQNRAIEKSVTLKTDKVAAKVSDKKQIRDDNFIPTTVEKLTGPKILDKIVLPVENKHKKKKPVASSTDNKIGQKKKKRKRIRTGNRPVRQNVKSTKDSILVKKKTYQKKKEVKKELTEEEIQKQIKETLARLAPSGKSKSSKHRRQKRETFSHQMEEQLRKQQEEKSILKVTEFVTANELANLMNINVNDVIKTCLQLGLFVSINQRLDAETIVLVVEEYGFKVEFVDIDDHESFDVEEEGDNEEDLIERAPIVTVMGHVDHGKTKLLDYIRKANVVAGEAGGITQHIGAYEVTTDSGKNITFLDTPGHEAFTAMRARGAKVTDVAIVVIASDDSVMPQTKEAINHAQAAGVPIVFAINKIDKPTANAEKIKEQLANLNFLVEDWGGKFQSQDVSAITGQGIPELLEKVLLEAELLELKANPNKRGKGTVLEASLDKGRGYVANILVNEGTVHKGDILIAGHVFGKVKAMFNERNKLIKEAGPSTPVLMLGLIGAPQAGDVFNVMKDEKEAKHIASKRQQLLREQSLRSQKHITLDEIGRRIAIGSFKELNIIVKGDVDGSVEALSDSLLKLSTEEVQVNVIHKAVGAIIESDILLASASNAIIIGFQVRPVPQARKLAEKEQIDIRLYSIIYQAIEELKAAILGMLEKKEIEKITCNIDVREVFKISKVGTIAGCYVLDGKINRNTKVRLIRNGIVVYTGNLGSLKRFKDDVKEVATGYECGLNIENFNDIKVGDIVEGFEMVEV